MTNKRNWIVLLALCVCLLAGIAQAQDTSAQYGIIQGGSLHMRAEPSKEAGITATYEGGTWVQIIGDAQDGFVQVIAEDGEEGYMMAGYILPDTLDEGDWGTVENGSRHVNLRSGPSGDASVIGHVTTGDRFELLAYGEDWAMVRFDGASVGYVSAKLIRLDGETEWKAEKTHTAHGDSVNLHAAPVAGSAVLGSYPKGTEVVVLIEGTTWSKVFVDDEFGYMNTASLTAHTAKKAQKQTSAPLMMPLETPHPKQQPDHYQEQPSLIMGAGPAGPMYGYPRSGDEAEANDFIPDGMFHNGVTVEVSGDQLDG